MKAKAQSDSAHALRKASRKKRLTLAGLFLGVTAATGAYWWQQHENVEVRQSLPALPQIDGRLAVLEEELSRVDRAARTGTAQPDEIAQLGRLYHANGYLEKAETCWLLLVGKQPQNARWLYYLADLRKARSDQEGMAALLTEVLKRDENYAPARLHLANFRFKQGRLDEAREHYEQRLHRLPDDPYSLLGLARISLQQQNTAHGTQILRKLVEKHPGFSAGHNLYAELLAQTDQREATRWHRWLGRESGRFREAEDPWLNEIADACLDPKRVAVMATVDFQTGQIQTAKQRIDKLLMLTPDSPAAIELLADYHRKTGNLQQARSQLEKALRLAGHENVSASIVISLAECLRELGRPAEALQVIQEVRDRQPMLQELHGAAGVALADLNRHAEAVGEFETALKISPNDAETNFNLALSQLSLEQEEAARFALSRALSQQPTFPKALSLLAELEMSRGRIADAEVHARALFEAYPGMPDARQIMATWHVQAGKTYERAQQVTRAREVYREGLMTFADDPGLQGAYGLFCTSQNDWSNAVAAFEAYVRLKPNDAGGVAYLGEAYARSGRLDEARKTLADGIALAHRTGQTSAANRCRELLQKM